MSAKPVLYTLDFSPPARSVVLTARHIGLELDIRTINVLRGDHMTEEYFRMNPQHTIPTLDDNGLYLWESGAICTYLIDTYGPTNCPMYPSDNRALRALIDQRLYFCAGVLFPEVRRATIVLMCEQQPEFEAVHLARVRSAYDHLESFLKEPNAEDEERRFMVGATLTLADLALIPTVTASSTWAPMDATGRHRRLAAWLRRCEAAIEDYEELNGEPNRRYAAQMNEWQRANRALAATK